LKISQFEVIFPSEFENGRKPDRAKIENPNTIIPGMVDYVAAGYY